jgi:hypothetical protein
VRDRSVFESAGGFLLSAWSILYIKGMINLEIHPANEEKNTKKRANGPFS